jgi:two-component system, chemotaxis family, protein-glutamate methylesterase/glutaminase
VFELICIGASWGGLQAVSRVLSDIPADLEQPIVIAQHRHPNSVDSALPDLLALQIPRRVTDIDDKARIEPRTVYVAPPDYHVLVEPGSFALSLEDRVQFARPSIDVLFESAAEAYRERLIGVILTGANADGAAGLRQVKERGGVAVVQDPAQALRRTMPDAAMAATVADAVLPVEEIGKFLYGLCVRPAAERPVRASGPVEGAWGNREVPPAGSRR